MIDLETIEYFTYMEEQDKKEDEVFKEVMNRYMEYESQKILEEMKNRNE